MNLSKIYRKISIANLGLILVLAVTAVYSMYESLRMHQDIESIITLWLLAGGISVYTTWHRVKKKALLNPHDLILSWIFLVAACGALLLTIYISNELALQISLVLLFGACLARFANYFNVFKLMPAGVIYLLLLPNSDYFLSLISYPLRLICSKLTYFTLKLFTVEVSCNATVLMLGTEKIAVTTACSGISQLEAMFLIGWVIAIIAHKRLICQISHWLLLVPIVILINSIRLTVTLLLYMVFGNVIFGDTVHTLLGYLMVIGVTWVFWLCRSLIPFADVSEKEEVKK